VNLAVVEYLSFFSYLSFVMPRFLSGKDTEVYYIDASPVGGALANWSKVRKLSFRLADIHDERGDLVRLRIAYFDFNELEKKILKTDTFQKVLNDPAATGRVREFLTKRVSSFDLGTHDTVWRAMFLVHVACWKAKETKSKFSKVTLCMRRRAWQAQISEYALSYQVEVVAVTSIDPNPKALLRRLLADHLDVIKSFLLGFKRYGIGAFGRIFKFIKEPAPFRMSVAVEYYGQLNLKRPELNSDLFFWQKSHIPANDVGMLFHLTRDPLDASKKAEMDNQGIRSVVLNPLADQTDGQSEVFYHLKPGKKFHFQSLPRFGGSKEERWLRRQLKLYGSQYNYWTDFFKRYQTKVYMSWFNTHAAHCVIADALEACGGVTAIYQRSAQELASIETSVAADINFVFSNMAIDVEKESLSKVPYMVTVGFIGDHRFKLLKPMADDLRKQLHAAGANRIVAFFDENSGEDDRWHTGHDFMRANYEFLLKRFLEDSKIGLIFKPKVPSSLRKRLGPVAALLREAQATGRCLVMEGGAVQGAYPPAVAALASDITIHGHLCAVTAGLESALAGVPTLLMDREGWSHSCLHRLDSKVVFKEWDHLWNTVQDHWQRPGGVLGLGDWSSILTEFDPFRDGRAAERVGMYMDWLMEGFNAKLPRQDVLARAAQRYTDMWGKDKVNAVNCHG
jgi:hypothetical protein